MPAKRNGTALRFGTGVRSGYSRRAMRLQRLIDSFAM
jgi:hypothetical protein